jgi:hypothetical protein
MATLRGFSACVPESPIVASTSGRCAHLWPSLCSFFRPYAGARSRLFVRRIHASNDRGRGAGSDRLGVSCALLPCDLLPGLGEPLATNGPRVSAESMRGELQAGTFLPECAGDAVRARQ